MSAQNQKQLRDQLLSENPSTHALSGFGPGQPTAGNTDRAQSMLYQMGYVPEIHQPHPNQQRPLTNHDLVTPVLDLQSHANASSRKSSMNIRLFRRKGNEPVHFDDDKGADILDFAAAQCSINDLTHLRDSGRYNTMGFGASDTAPIIPTFGTFDGKPKNMNNVQYRKHMNHQKKMNLAQSARAMSLAGGNPMASGTSRTLSLVGGGGPYDRAMSLGMASAANNRAMSLNSNVYLQQGRGPPPQQQQRPMMRNGAISPNHNYPMGQPHTMSLRSNSGYPQQQRGPPPMGARANSMGMRLNPNYFNGGPPGQFQGHPGQFQGQGQPQGPPGHFQGQGPPQGPYVGAQGYPGQIQGQQGQFISQGLFNGPPRTRSFTDPSKLIPQKQGFPPISPPMDSSASNNSTPTLNPGPIPHPAWTKGALLGLGQQSNDSLMNVVEEEEEDSKIHPQKSAGDRLSLKDFKSKPLPAHDLDSFLPPTSPGADEGDHVFRFDNSLSPQVSRKSTIKKTNSKRVRKLDLFSSDPVQDDDKTESVQSPPRINCENLDSPLSPAGSQSSPNSKKSAIKLRSLTANTVFSNFRSVLSQGTDSLSKPEEQSPDSENVKSSGASLRTEFEQGLNASNSVYSGSTKGQEKETTDEFNLQKTLLQSSMVSSAKISVPAEKLDEVSSKLEPLQSKSSAYSVDASELQIDNPKRHLQLPSAEVLTKASQEIERRASTLSRSNSELKLQGFLPTSSLLKNTSRIPSTSSIQELDDDKKDKRKSGVSARGLIKRLSKSSIKRAPEEPKELAKESFSFTKEELAIMTCNNDLQNELQLVTSELALSIKRELDLENQLRSRQNTLTGSQKIRDGLADALAEKSRIIADLQDKLNNERRLRFISEEHAILAENGQSPSALKLDYEKNEIYKQLLVKNDLVTQLQDKLEESAQISNGDSHESLLHKYNDLVKENSDLKARLRDAEAHNLSNDDGNTDDTSEDDSDSGANQEYEKAQIMSLRTQRDELREMIVKLTVSQNTELKVANDRIKLLETKLEKANPGTLKQSRRLLRGENESVSNKSTDPFSSSQGGRLQGLNIVSPTNKLFD